MSHPSRETFVNRDRRITGSCEHEMWWRDPCCQHRKNRQYKKNPCWLSMSEPRLWSFADTRGMLIFNRMAWLYGNTANRQLSFPINDSFADRQEFGDKHTADLFRRRDRLAP